MLRVGQVDAYTGLADYKVHVITIELSSDVWGKKNIAYYTAASKGSDSLVLQPGVFHNKEKPRLGISARRSPRGWHRDWGAA